MTPQTLAALLRAGTMRLRSADIDGAARDARFLLAEAARVPRDRLTLHLSDPAAPGVASAYDRLLADRVARMPVSRILGRRAFYGRSFEVTEDVLDPRPETETLVALALAGRVGRVLDLGTGSGCLLVTLLAERPDATGTGTDISERALAVARRNAERLGVLDRTAWQRSDWFDGVEGRFDLIVSNPPYIAAQELDGLTPEVRNHDPLLALSPGGDGLAAYRAVSARAAGFLLPAGRLLVEIGPTQGQAVADLFRAGGLTQVGIHPDLDGRPRVVAGILP